MNITIKNNDLTIGGSDHSLSFSKTTEYGYLFTNNQFSILVSRGDESEIFLYGLTNNKICYQCNNRVFEKLHCRLKTLPFTSISFSEEILNEVHIMQRVLVLLENSAYMTTWVASYDCTNSCLSFPLDPLPGEASFYQDGSVEKLDIIEGYICRSIINIDDSEFGFKDFHAACCMLHAACCMLHAAQIPVKLKLKKSVCLKLLSAIFQTIQLNFTTQKLNLILQFYHLHLILKNQK